ncbi:hypothetical protein [Ferrimonas marina]|uniref:Uncharacterized protein n=1 Tax=Ferrimonas marina TaxID=299255 RepID=A0A1M5VPP3_9GAMM|nr:hypothetical protein [Ferrimonas marina]SHH77229.1 hypothetical protein SAMN02745129_2903 [Ferrimonas marina]
MSRVLRWVMASWVLVLLGWSMARSDELSFITFVDTRWCAVSEAELLIHDASGALLGRGGLDDQGRLMLSDIPDDGFLSLVEQDPVEGQVITTTAKSLLSADTLWPLNGVYGSGDSCKPMAAVELQARIVNDNEFALTMLTPSMDDMGLVALHRWQPWLLATGHNAEGELVAYRLERDDLLDDSVEDLLLDQPPVSRSWRANDALDHLSVFWLRDSLPYLMESKPVNTRAGSVNLVDQPGKVLVAAIRQSDGVVMQRLQPFATGDEELILQVPRRPQGLFDRVELTPERLSYSLGAFQQRYSSLVLDFASDQGRFSWIVHSEGIEGAVVLPQLPTPWQALVATGPDTLLVQSYQLDPQAPFSLLPLLPDPELMEAASLVRWQTGQATPFTLAQWFCDLPDFGQIQC